MECRECCERRQLKQESGKGTDCRPTLAPLAIAGGMVMKGMLCSPTDLTESSNQFADSQMQRENVVSETTMKKPIPPDLLAQLRSHQQWSQTQGKGGKQLEAEGLDLI